MKVTDTKTTFQTDILDALSDDLNTSKAYALIDEMISHVNETLDSHPKDKLIKKEALSNLAFIEKLLGVGSYNPFEYFQFGIDQEMKDKIDSLITKRSEAKKAKDFATSDTIRDEILSLGISIMDTADGTFWEKSI